MFLIPFCMTLMALGQQGERPCPMVWLSDRIDASVPPPASIYSRFSPVVINLLICILHLDSPQGPAKISRWSNRPAQVQNSDLWENHLISVSFVSFFPLSLTYLIQCFWVVAVFEMYSPQRKDFVSLTLGDQYSHSYTNGKHRRKSCWRVST